MVLNIVWTECSDMSFYELFAINFWIGFWIFDIDLTQVKVFLSHNNNNSFLQEITIRLIQANTIRV